MILFQPHLKHHKTSFAIRQEAPLSVAEPLCMRIEAALVVLSCAGENVADEGNTRTVFLGGGVGVGWTITHRCHLAGAIGGCHISSYNVQIRIM